MFKSYIPKSIQCFREGYNKQTFFNDLLAGLCVGIIALPLALAFAIASGVEPERGLFTAIVAGFLISLLGGSRVQIGGPTGAFVVIVYATVQKHGYEGLVLATFLGAALLIVMGLARLGSLLKYIPEAVITGFTAGIAVVIATSQIKDFFGLEGGAVPLDFVEKCLFLCQIADTWKGSALLIALFTLILIFVLKRYFPKVPGAMLAIVLASLSAYFLNLPLETIHSKFGALASHLPAPSFPSFSFDQVKAVFPDAIAIALLGGIESLLSAVVADKMIGTRHKSNGELIAQGLANIGSALFGGIPATGAIARTATNVRMGAKTPMAGMIHAVTLLLMMFFLAPLVGKIPLATLAGTLLYVAWNMSDLPLFITTLKSSREDALLLITSFFLTIFIDLIVAVQAGVFIGTLLHLKRSKFGKKPLKTHL